MKTPTNYLIAASVCLAFAYLIYLLFFRKETNFRQRRFFLIFAAVFSLLLPTGSYYILLPLTTKAETQTQVLTPSPVLESPVPHVATPDFYPVNPVTLSDTEPKKNKRSINLLQVLQYIYIAGMIVLLLRFIVQLVTISIWYSQSRKVKQPLFTLLFHERFSTPFSFFKWIFLTKKRLPETDFEKIIAHESVHVKQKHSFDAVFFELLCIFMWFNPFVWMMRRSINLTHEFLADERVIESGIDSLHYQALMVNQVAEANIVSVTSHFNKSLLSQRIKMIANSRFYKKAKYKILVLAPVALVLFLFIAGVNGLNQRKVLYRNLKKEAVISKVFSKDEIKDLVELRLMTDEMVINTTGEPDTKLAYPKFNELLSGKETVSEVKEKMTLSHDSLVTVVKSHPALLEIYDVSNSNNMSFSINRHGKVMEFLLELSKQNEVYKEIREMIEIAGDISPSNISSFIKESEKYNMESEAERLYASIIYGILTNRILKRGETGDIHRSSTYAHLDTELVLLRFHAYQKNPTDRNAGLLYEALPEKGHIKLEDSEREVVDEIGDNLMTLEKQVLSEQRNSVKVAFRMFTISDGAFSEWLQIMLGNLITINPKMFLEELKVHRHLFNELPIYNLGPEFVDKSDERIEEYKLRINALETVSANDLADTKERCIELLEKKLTPFERFKFNNDLKPEPNIIIVNKSDYSRDFIESIRNSTFRGSDILLDRNKFILENDSVTYYFPDYIPIGHDINLSGQYRNLKIDLSFKRINQSSIDYAFQVYKGENKITENAGTGNLSPFFWLGLEVDFDQDLRKEFKYEEFKDDGAKVSIRIGKDDNGGLKAKILYGIRSEAFYIDRNNSPVLRTKTTTSLEKDGRQGVERENSNGGSGNAGEIIRLRKLPKLNSYLSDSIRQESTSIGLMINSAQIYRSTKIKVDGIMFNIAWDSDNRVSYIMTTDANFSTAKGARINMTLKELKKRQDVKIRKEPGWAYYADLNPGWSVAFSFDETATGRELLDSDSIKWIFKRAGSSTETTISQDKDSWHGVEHEKRSSDTRDAEVIIHDKDNYSADFIAGLYRLPSEYRKIELRGEILILNDTIFEILPEYLGSGKIYKMEGTDDNVKVSLSFTQNTYSSVDYVFQVNQTGEPRKQFAGVAELQASFFLGGKTEIDNEKNEAFNTLQLVDNSNAIPLFINIGKDGLFQLRCRIENDDFKSPVLRSRNIEEPNQPSLSKNHIGDLRKMSVQTLFACLRFKSSANFMADQDKEKFIVYGDFNGTDFSGTRLDVRNWLSYDDLKFLMDNLESQEVCKNMMSIFSSQRPDYVGSTIGGFAAMFLDFYRKNQLFHPLIAISTNNPDLVQELKEWWKNYKNENTRYFEIDDVLVKVYQQNNSDQKLDEDFLCHGKVISYKNYVSFDSLNFNDMEAVGDRYGLNFNAQPVKGMVIGTKYGDYDGRLILIDETGKIQNHRGGFFFITKDQRYIVSPWHSDLQGITIYDLKSEELVKSAETEIVPANWYFLDGEYFISEWGEVAPERPSDPERFGNFGETGKVFRLNLQKGGFEQSEYNLEELTKGELVQMLNNESCACN